MNENIPRLKTELNELLEQEDSWELHGQLRDRHVSLVKLLLHEDVMWDEEGEQWAEYRLLDERIKTRLETLKALEPVQEQPVMQEKLPPHPRRINPLKTNPDAKRFARGIMDQKSYLRDNLKRMQEAHVLDTIKAILPFLLLEPEFVASLEDNSPVSSLDNAQYVYDACHALAVSAYESRNKEQWLALAQAIANATIPI